GQHDLRVADRHLRVADPSAHVHALRLRRAEYVFIKLDRLRGAANDQVWGDVRPIVDYVVVERNRATKADGSTISSPGNRVRKSRPAGVSSVIKSSRSWSRVTRNCAPAATARLMYLLSLGSRSSV